MEAKEIEEFNNSLEKINDDSGKIDFIERYLRENTEIKLNLLAFLYESLAELYLGAGRPKANFYKKAASNWELYSTYFTEEEDKEKTESLKRALENYKKAFYIFKNQNEKAELELVKENITEIKKSLKGYTSTKKKVFLSATFLFFIFSLFFLVASPTGLVIAPLEPEQNAIVGSIFALFAIVGLLITKFALRY